MDAEIKEVLRQLLTSPKQYSVDGESIMQQSAGDFLALLRKLEEAEKAGENPLKRCGFFKVLTEKAGR